MDKVETSVLFLLSLLVGKIGVVARLSRNLSDFLKSRSIVSVSNVDLVLFISLFTLSA